MAASWPDPLEIFEHYLRTIEALTSLKSSLLTDLTAGTSAIAPSSRFLNRTALEIEETFREMKAELDIQINLLLIASGEASLRVDFQDRVIRRKKDPVSKRFRDLERVRNSRKKKGVRLEDLLEIWKGASHQVSARQNVGMMGKLLLYRHWVAHGRYWVENKSGLTELDPYKVWKIMQRFFNALPGFPTLPNQ